MAAPTWTTPRTWTPVLIDEDDLNEQLRDNLGFLYACKGFSASLSAPQTTSASTWTKVQLNTEQYDPESWFDNATNYRFLPTRAGKYAITVTGVGDAIQGSVLVAIYKNGVLRVQARHHSTTSIEHSVSLTDLVDLNGSTDYVEFYVQQTSAGSRDFLATYTKMSGYFVGS